MINFNGVITPRSQAGLSVANRGFKYGDAVFETMVAVRERVCFLEDHYFRLLKSMRLMRMEIPGEFTLDYFEEQLQRLIRACGLSAANSRLRLTVYRIGEGLYAPSSHHVEYLAECSALPHRPYAWAERPYTVDVFRDFPVAASLLSTIKTNNKAQHVLAGIFARENELDNALLVNTEKQIVEAVQSNVFAVFGEVVKTPPLSGGALDGIIRKQLIRLAPRQSRYVIQEAPLLPFELQDADEIFLTNVVVGIQPVSNFKKKTFSSKASKLFLELLNDRIREDTAL